MPENEQVKLPDEPRTLTGFLRQRTLRMVNAVAGIFVRLGLSPNALTIIGLGISIAAGIFAGMGQLLTAGLILLFGAAFDAMDGAVARLTGRVTRFGALLDSSLDRYGEAVVLAGIGYYLAQQQNLVGLILVFATITGSIMVSYVRARSEGLQIDNKVGLLTRVERVIILGVMLLSGWLMVGLWVLALGTQFTVLQRIWFVWKAEQDTSNS